MTVNMHPMRRKDRTMPDAACMELLQTGEYGFLSTVGEDGKPYGIPLSYVLLDGKLYFHCARKGRKVENFRCCKDIAFCVVGRTQPVYDKAFSTYFESVMVFGELSEIAAGDERLRALHALAEKYLPEHMDKVEGDIKKSDALTAVYRIDIAHMSGKEKKPRPEAG